MELTNDRLQNIAVKCVAQYMAKQASLSEGIAKEAQELELNPEQVKRVIETTNTVAYLRQLGDAPDRTFEFPVADYKTVMSRICLPEKRAEEEDEEEKKESKEEEKKESKEDEKKESEEAEPSEQEKKAMLIMETRRCKEVLIKMAYDQEDLKQRLISAADSFRKDPFALEKLAEVVDEEDYSKMIKLCQISDRSLQDIVVTDSDVKEARKLYGLYKEAKISVAEETKLRKTVERAENYIKKAPA